MHAGRVAALLRTCARIPLLELGAADIRLGLGTHAPGVARGFAFLTISAWSYAPLSAVWEPVMEPWQVLAHLDHNTASRCVYGMKARMQAFILYLVCKLGLFCVYLKLYCGSCQSCRRSYFSRWLQQVCVVRSGRMAQEGTKLNSQCNESGVA